MEQQTIASAFALEGIGVHSGEPCRAALRPAPAGAGRTFRTAGKSIPAHSDYVVETARATTLGADGVTVGTVEHLLSALAACGIDNVTIDVDGPEVPFMDGSALPWVAAIRAAGALGQRHPVRRLRLRAPIIVEDGTSRIEAWPDDGYAIECHTNFAHWPEGAARMSLDLDRACDREYRDRVAPARTFAFDSEVELLRSSGLARGGSLDNALIITPPGEFSSPLRVEDEWCAHKLLDVIGDLALTGSRLQARVIAMRPGHRINIRMARALSAQSRVEEDERR